MTPNLKVSQSQQMSLSPQLVASIRLLQLSAAELEQEVAEALENNPLLEAEAPELEAPDAAEESQAAVMQDSAVSADAASPEPRGEIDIDDSFALAESWNAAPGDSDDEDHPLRRAAAPDAGLRARLEVADCRRPMRGNIRNTSATHQQHISNTSATH